MAISSSIDGAKNAHVGLRFLATLIDIFLIVSIATLIEFFKGSDFNKALFPFYYIVMLGSHWGTTVGGRILGIYTIERKSKKKICNSKALGKGVTLSIVDLLVTMFLLFFIRSIPENVLILAAVCIPLILLFLPSLFSRDNLLLHDIVTSTKVVKGYSNKDEIRSRSYIKERILLLSGITIITILAMLK